MDVASPRGETRENSSAYAYQSWMYSFDLYPGCLSEGVHKCSRSFDKQYEILNRYEDPLKGLTFCFVKDQNQLLEKRKAKSSLQNVAREVFQLGDVSCEIAKFLMSKQEAKRFPVSLAGVDFLKSSIERRINYRTNDEIYQFEKDVNEREQGLAKIKADYDRLDRAARKIQEITSLKNAPIQQMTKTEKLVRSAKALNLAQVEPALWEDVKRAENKLRQEFVLKQLNLFKDAILHEIDSHTHFEINSFENNVDERREALEEIESGYKLLEEVIREIEEISFFEEIFIDEGIEVLARCIHFLNQKNFCFSRVFKGLIGSYNTPKAFGYITKYDRLCAIISNRSFDPVYQNLDEVFFFKLAMTLAGMEEDPDERQRSTFFVIKRKYEILYERCSLYLGYYGKQEDHKSLLDFYRAHEEIILENLGDFDTLWRSHFAVVCFEQDLQRAFELIERLPENSERLKLYAFWRLVNSKQMGIRVYEGRDGPRFQARYEEFKHTLQHLPFAIEYSDQEIQMLKDLEKFYLESLLSSGEFEKAINLMDLYSEEDKVFAIDQITIYLLLESNAPIFDEVLLLLLDYLPYLPQDFPPVKEDLIDSLPPDILFIVRVLRKLIATGRLEKAKELYDAQFREMFIDTLDQLRDIFDRLKEQIDEGPCEEDFLEKQANECKSNIEILERLIVLIQDWINNPEASHEEAISSSPKEIHKVTASSGSIKAFGACQEKIREGRPLSAYNRIEEIRKGPDSKACRARAFCHLALYLIETTPEAIKKPDLEEDSNSSASSSSDSDNPQTLSLDRVIRRSELLLKQLAPEELEVEVISDEGPRTLAQCCMRAVFCIDKGFFAEARALLKEVRAQISSAATSS